MWNLWGSSNPFTLIRDNEKISEEIPSVFGSAFGGQNKPEEQRLEPIDIYLDCTLEELYNGFVKTI